jgi:hypothetical protein
LFLGYRSPHKPVDVVNGLDVRSDYGHFRSLRILGIDNGESFEARDLTKNPVGCDEVIDQTSYAKIDRDGQLQSIKRAQSKIERIAPDQCFRKRELKFTDRNHVQLSSGNIASELVQKHFGITPANRSCSYLDRESGNDFRWCQTGDSHHTSGCTRLSTNGVPTSTWYSLTRALESKKYDGNS